MLIQSGLLDEYIKVLNVQKWTTGLFCKWSYSTKQLHLNTRPLKIASIICGIISALRVIDISRGSEEGGAVEGPLSIMVTVHSILITHFCMAMVKNMTTLKKLFAGMASFEERYCKNGSGLTLEEKRKLKVARTTCKIMREVGTKSTPVAMALVAVIVPKLPFNVLVTPPGGWILATIESGLLSVGASKWIAWAALKLVAFTINLWFQVLAYGSGIILTNQLIIITNVLTVATSMFHRRLEKLVSAKQGENLPSHISQKMILMYRETQLLSGYLNQIHCFVMITMLATAVIGQVVSILGVMATGTEDKGSDDNGITFYFLQMSYIEGFILCALCVNSIFGFCGSVYDNSKSCLDNLRHQENLQRNKFLKRIVKSLQGIRVNFGRDNYIDKLTPVVYQQFTNEKIVDTLLLRES